MNKPKDPKPNPTTARALLNRLAASLATLARCAEQIARHVPDAQLGHRDDPQADERAAQAVENPHPPRKRGRPIKYHSQAEREAARRAQCNAAFKRWIAKPENKARRRAQQRASMHAAKTAPADLRTPADMPRAALRVGACYALGMRYSAIAAALDMPKGSLRNAMHRFNQHAGLTTIADAPGWFESMRADPAAYAPHADRRQWATAYAKRATTEAKRKAARNGWKARRRAR